MCQKTSRYSVRKWGLKWHDLLKCFVCIVSLLSFMKGMSQSDLILKTYREITTKLEKPYYVLEGIPANAGNNHILYSSPSLKEVIGLTQYELSSDPNLFFNSIHPKYIDDYLESNRRLLDGKEKDRRIYLIKNKDTNEFVPIEELATSRLNKERNCYEIYCSLQCINEAMEVKDEADLEMISRAFSKLQHLTPEKRNSIFETTHHFVDSMAQNFNLNACRFYGYSEDKKELSIFADNQNRRAKQIMEATTRVKTRTIVPSYSEESLFFRLLSEKEYQVFTEKPDIIDILKAHTDNGIIKKFAGTALRIYNIKSFGFLPICSAAGHIVGLVTFAASQPYTEEQKKEIYDFAATNSFVFTTLLSEICND